MDVGKRIGQRLADKSAVGCDKSAPTVWPEDFVNLHKRDISEENGSTTGWKRSSWSFASISLPSIRFLYSNYKLFTSSSRF